MKVRWAKTFGLELVPFIFGAIFVTAFTERPLIGVAILLMAITSIGYNSYRIVDRIDGAEQRIIELEDDLDEAERRAEELEEEIEEAKSLAWIL